MPYKDPVVAKEKAKECKKRQQDSQRIERINKGLPADGRGKHKKHAKGVNAGRWNTGKIISSHGYIKSRVGRNHPLADPNGYAYEHLLVWRSAGRILPKANELIHHKNENKTDNRLENLELKTRANHNIYHNQAMERNNIGQFVSNKAGRVLDGKIWNKYPTNS